MKAIIAKRIITILLMIGIGFRLFLFLVSPPNNAHDNHLEVVHLYADAFERPLLFDCFECYQPPLYYYLSAVVYRSAVYLDLDTVMRWKMVQSINLFLSILVLLIFYKILVERQVSENLRIVYLSFLVVLPRDIFTSAMIVNDYFIVFATIASLLFYLRCLQCFEKKETHGLFYNFIGLSFFTLLGTIAKQHGLILLLLPSSLVLIYFFENRPIAIKKFLPIVLIVIGLAFFEEWKKYQESGKFLVSNQDHFPNAQNQFPASRDKVEFFSFNIIKLFQQPFLTEETAASVPTEVFARTFFDYEWRFLSPRTAFAVWVGRLAYLVGLVWGVFFFSSFISWIRKKIEAREKPNWISYGYTAPVLLGICFLLVPFLQTFRFPHYSSMKAMFALPGIVVLLGMFPIIANKINIPNRYAVLLVGMNILFGGILLISIYSVLETEIALDNLKGPLWAYPEEILSTK